MRYTTAVILASTLIILSFAAAWLQESALAPPPRGGTGEESVGVSADEPRFEAIDAERVILIHCESFLRSVAERVASEFQEREGVAVRFNFGETAELLSEIELGGEGDLWLGRDSCGDRLDEKGLLRKHVTIGYIEPVIIVPPGNPQSIESLADLSRPGLRVGLPDARYSTVGGVIERALAARNLLEAVHRQVGVEARASDDAAVALIQGDVDVAMTWDFVADHYKGSVEQVTADVEFPQTRFTICLLDHARDQEAAQMFMDMAASPLGRRIFDQAGHAGNEVQQVPEDE